MLWIRNWVCVGTWITTSLNFYLLLVLWVLCGLYFHCAFPPMSWGENTRLNSFYYHQDSEVGLAEHSLKFAKEFSFTEYRVNLGVPSPCWTLTIIQDWLPKPALGFPVTPCFLAPSPVNKQFLDWSSSVELWTARVSFQKAKSTTPTFQLRFSSQTLFSALYCQKWGRWWPKARLWYLTCGMPVHLVPALFSFKCRATTFFPQCFH